ncbi:MAG: NTP transferase domain-containing protein [Halobacteriovoraceae bacterium]|nr:NTP transferase domain-containing protein [Halobacteriovoraceae bacterium]
MERSTGDISVLVLAGGLATRMRPLTEKFPKILLEVAGRPFLFHQLELLRKNGFRNIIFSTGYLGELVEEAFEGNKEFKDFNIAFCHDGKNRLGTGGATKNSLDLLTDIFVVLYGDSYLLYDYSKILKSFDETKYNALMTVYHNEDLHDSSNVYFENGDIVKYDKIDKTSDMKHIDWGFNIFQKSAFENFKDLEIFDLSEVFQKSLKDNKLQGFEVGQRFYEIGSIDGLEELNTFLRKNL